MATLSDPGTVMVLPLSFITDQNYMSTVEGKVGDTLTGTMTNLGSTLVTPIGSRLKLVTGEVTSDGANLLPTPVYQFWG